MAKFLSNKDAEFLNSLQRGRKSVQADQDRINRYRPIEFVKAAVNTAPTWSGPKTVTANIQRYDPATGSWSTGDEVWLQGATHGRHLCACVGSLTIGDDTKMCWKVLNLDEETEDIEEDEETGEEGETCRVTETFSVVTEVNCVDGEIIETTRELEFINGILVNDCGDE